MTHTRITIDILHHFISDMFLMDNDGDGQTVDII